MRYNRGMGLPDQDASVFSHRREALARSASTPAVFFSGALRPRNYPANTYPFRVDSHFLYLTGASIDQAALLVSPEGSELFLEPKAEDDALWHGETAGWDEIAARTGVQRIRPLGELDAAIAALGGPEQVGTLPCADPSTRVVQGRHVPRPWAAPGHVPRGEELEGPDGAVADAMIGLRLIHDQAALDKLRRAAEGTRAAHLAGMAITRPGVHEYTVRGAMEGALMELGMTVSYQPIVTTRGEVLHNMTYVHELRAGDMVLADVGAEHDGWAGDVTRTWPVTGRFSPTQRTMYEIVLASQRAAIDKVRPGTRYRDVHLEAARVLTRGLVDEGILKGEVDGLVEQGAHAIFFPHGVGHIIGLDVHDMEDLGDRAGYAPGRTRSDQFGLGHLRLDRDLEPGMMVTIEPGFYRIPAILADARHGRRLVESGVLDLGALDRFADVRGIRIEDDVLCTQGDPEVFTADIPKGPAEVEAAVGRE